MKLFGRFDKSPPAIQPLAFVESDSHPGLMPVPDPHPDQTGGDHLGVIGHHHITGAQKAGQIGNLPIKQLAGLDNQHAGRIARARRTQGNPAVGQFKIEQIDIHERNLSSKPTWKHARSAENRIKITIFTTLDFKSRRRIL
jgi:hypothetical protein